MKTLTLIFILCIINAGCSNRHSIVPQEKITIEDQQNDSLTKSKYQEIWDMNFKSGIEDGPNSIGHPLEIDPFLIYLDGLNSENPNIRWYCINMLYNYLNSDYQYEIISGIKKLQKDKVDYVRESANIAISAFTKDYTHSVFHKSHNGKDVAFFRFSNARHNDGILYLYQSELDYFSHKQIMDGDIGKISWSPDDRFICINYDYPCKHAIVIYNIENDEAFGSDLFENLLKTKEMKGISITKNHRTYDSMELLDWSLDSKKVLIQYNFPDISEHYYRGKIVFDIEKNKIIKVIPADNSKSYEEVSKMGDFKWTD